MASRPVLDAVVIGAGSAGLGMSFLLAQAGMRHRLLERGRIGETWRRQRWDSFQMNTPNWSTAIPGTPYYGGEPDGFYSRDQFVGMLEDHASRHRLPVETATPVLELATGEAHGATCYHVTTNQSRPKLPALARSLPEGPLRLVHTADYRSADALPAGEALVVGCATSGMQIAEDLIEAAATRGR
jgi:putative flavoprotein involved in K+ transport